MESLPQDCIDKIYDEVVKCNFSKVLEELLNPYSYTDKWGLNRVGEANEILVSYETLLRIDNRIELYDDHHSIIGSSKFPIKAFTKVYDRTRSATNRWKKYHYVRTVPNVIIHEGRKNKRIDVIYEVWITQKLSTPYGDYEHNFVDNVEIVTNVQNDKEELKKLLDFYENLTSIYEESNFGKKYEDKDCYVTSDDDLEWSFGEIDEIEEMFNELQWAHDPKYMKEICCLSDSDEDVQNKLYSSL